MSEVEILEKVIIEWATNTGVLPSKLYKYRPLCGTQSMYIIDRTRDIIQQQKLYFATPKSFEDVNDFNPRISGDSPIPSFRKLRIREMYESVVSASRLPSTLINSESFVAEYEQGVELLETILESRGEILRTKLGVCCFSRTFKSYQLWDKYADHFKGVCFEFEVIEDTGFFTTPLRMTYDNEYPEFDQSSPYYDPFAIMKMLATKSRDWVFEDEVRVIKSQSEYYPFRKNALKRVIFGYKCPPQLVRKVESLLSESGYNSTESVCAIPDVNRVIKLASM